MSTFEPLDPDYEARVRASFARQGFMRTLGAEILRIVPGEVDLVLPSREDLTQQHGYFHAGVTSTIADTAAGYAALSLYPKGTGVLTTEFKINLLRPAEGRQLTICQSDVYGERDGRETHVATSLLTMICLEGLDG